MLLTTPGHTSQNKVTVTYFQQKVPHSTFSRSVPYLACQKARTFETPSVHAPYHSRSSTKQLGHCDLLLTKMYHIVPFSRSVPYLASQEVQTVETTSVHASYNSRSSHTKLGHCDLLSQKIPLSQFSRSVPYLACQKVQTFETLSVHASYHSRSSTKN